MNAIENYEQINQEVYLAGGAPIEIIQAAFEAVTGSAPHNAEAQGNLIWTTATLNELPDFYEIEEEVNDEFYVLMEEFLNSPLGENYVEMVGA